MGNKNSTANVQMKQSYNNSMPKNAVTGGPGISGGPNNSVKMYSSEPKSKGRMGRSMNDTVSNSQGPYKTRRRIGSIAPIQNAGKRNLKKRNNTKKRKSYT